MTSDLLLGRLLLIVGVVGISLALCWWSLRTCRVLWRRGTNAWERLVYDYGVRFYGAILAIFLVVGGGYAGAAFLATSANDRTRCMIAGLILGAVIGIPISLGSGYVWGTWMAKLYGLKRPVGPATNDAAATSDRPNGLV